MGHKIFIFFSIWLTQRFKSQVFKIKKRLLFSLTSGETSLLVTFGELNGEIGDQSMDVIIALNLQTEGWGEGQVLWLHSVDVHFLKIKLPVAAVIYFRANELEIYNHAILEQSHCTITGLQLATTICDLSHTHAAHVCQCFLIIHHDYRACTRICVCVKAHRLNHGWQMKPARTTHAVWVSSLMSTREGGFVRVSVCMCVLYQTLPYWGSHWSKYFVTC